VLIRLLGPVDVLADDGPRQVRGLRRKAVLATLALHGGEVVSAGRLAAMVWGEDAPPTVVNTLQSHVSYLRALLGSKTAICARAKLTSHVSPGQAGPRRLPPRRELRSSLLSRPGRSHIAGAAVLQTVLGGDRVPQGQETVLGCDRRVVVGPGLRRCAVVDAG
jgi:hypothetical protein